MDVLGGCIALGICVFALGGIVLGWLAYVRLGRLERRIEDLERRATGAGTLGLETKSSRRVDAPPPPIPPSVRRPASDGSSLAERMPNEPTVPHVAAAEDASERAVESIARPAPPRAPLVEPARALDASSTPPLAGSTARPAESPGLPRGVHVEKDVPPSSRPDWLSKPIDLERWLGVRGAAVLGGVFLAIAGFLFLQHSIERGWITPKTRVITAAIFGVACFVASFPLRRRGYGITAAALAGGGAVILYAASWAASMLYPFVSPLVSFAAMAAVTAACVYVAWKHGARLVAVLGLVGGFATPLVLSTGQDRPFALFGYVLLLDLAFLFLAGRRKWPAIGFVALIGTTLIQGVWVALKMDPGESWIGLGVLGLFALVFAAYAARRPASEQSGWLPAQAGAVLLPFGFVVYFAHEIALAIPLGALTVLAALLCAAAGVLARRSAMPWLPVGAASGSAALFFTWVGARDVAFDARTSWLVAACALGLVALQHAFAEKKRADGSPVHGSVAGAAVAAISTLALAAWASLDRGEAHVFPWIACFAATALVLQRLSALSRRVELAWIGACGAGAALALRHAIVSPGDVHGIDVARRLAIVALGVGLVLAAHARRSAQRAAAFAAASTYCAIAMVACCNVWMLAGDVMAADKTIAVAAVFALSVVALAAATGARAHACVAVAAVVACSCQAAHAEAHAIAASPWWSAFVAILAATSALFAAWPLATRASWRTSPFAWCVAAVQPLAFAVPIHALVVARLTDSFAFATPLAFALGVGAIARTLWRTNDDEGTDVLRETPVAYTLTALLLASSVIPVHVDRAPFATTLALFGASVAVLWTRVDLRAVKWLAVAAIALSAFALVTAPGTWSFAVPPRPIANVHAWMYLVPAACAVFASVRIGALELQRLRGFEATVVGTTRAIAAGITGAAAVVIVFTWINVEIAGLYAIGERAGVDVPHERGRALATSIGWAVYALALLALGVTRKSSGPRWASLVLFLVTIAKVFLFDLGHLEGLQRAASMLGLALSLIAVSLVYQRFVFRRAQKDDTKSTTA